MVKAPGQPFCRSLCQADAREDPHRVVGLRRHEQLSNDELIDENTSASVLRPATWLLPGSHPAKMGCSVFWVPNRLAMQLTEGYAMLRLTAAAAASISHPDSRYFCGVDKDGSRPMPSAISVSIEQAERDLAPNLGYKRLDKPSLI